MVLLLSGCLDKPPPPQLHLSRTSPSLLALSSWRVRGMELNYKLIAARSASRLGEVNEFGATWVDQNPNGRDSGLRVWVQDGIA